jgi:hypothetical protein
MDPQRAEAWSANAGWFNWSPDATDGVQVSLFICSGYIYSANLGWINLGNGSPANGIQYQNNSATDFGVNITSQGELRGFAYSANAGWINFENTGAPRLDLSSGDLSGFAYGANIGWINLGDPGFSSFSVAVSSVSPGADTNGNGIPDAWEMFYAGNLTTFTATSDSDNDGATDLEEFIAGTDPLDPTDCLRVVQFSFSPDKSESTITWTTKPLHQYRIQTRDAVDPKSTWQDSGLGWQVPDGALTTRTLPADSSRKLLRIEVIRLLSP